MKQKILSKTVMTPVGELMLGAFCGRLCLCDWVDDGKPRALVANRLRRMTGGDISPLPPDRADGFEFSESYPDSDVIALAKNELARYFDGELRRFTVPLSFFGTDLQMRVWSVISAIPYGQAVSYKRLAEMAGRPAAVRAVATACGANALSIFVPCHRVVAQGDSKPLWERLGGYAGGLQAKHRLLALEGAMPM